MAGSLTTIIVYVMSQQKIYVNSKIAYKKQTLEHNCVLKPWDVDRDLFCLPMEVTA